MINLGNVFILGDSYSTFENNIPEGFATYYGAELHSELNVKTVNDTWWKQLLDETKSNLVLNSSWSGTTICKTGYDNIDRSEICFIGRLDKLIDNGFFKENKIDTFFVFGGTNDNWVPSPIGELKFSNWKSEELFSFCPAACYLLYRLKTCLPDTKIICIINSGLKAEITENLKTACEHYGVEYVALKNIEKMNGHPTKNGMTEIKNQIIEFLE